MTERERSYQRFLERQAEKRERWRARCTQSTSKAAHRAWREEQSARREEQRGRYIDCGALVWDDRDPSREA